MGRILVGYDGSPPARRAVDHAAARAKDGDEIVLLTVIPPQVRESRLSKLVPASLELPPELSRTFHENAQMRLDALASEMKAAGVKVRAEVRVGMPPAEFMRVADELGVSEIVIGHKAFEGPHLTLGENAEAIMRDAKVPVTLVH